MGGFLVALLVIVSLAFPRPAFAQAANGLAS